MDTKTFLSRVTAAVDDLVICTLKPDPNGNREADIFWNRGSFKDLDAAAAAIAQWDASQEWSVYFTVGNMSGHEYTKPNGSTGYRRKQEHATQFKALCFDIDVGDKYKTQRDAHTAVMAALDAIKLPNPMVVDSGRGIHYYWPLTKPVGRAHWEKASVALRVALAEQQVAIDFSKIHDPSMVLRPVGTHNKKQTPWKPVRLLADCADYDPVALFTLLKPWLNKGVQAPAAKRPMGGIAAAVLRNNNLDLDVLSRKCRQIAAMLASGGEFDAAGQQVEEPMWRGGLGICAFTPDPEASVLRMCSAHPTFDLQQNLDKMSRWSGGPTTCAYFEQHCPGGCAGCAYKGTAVSPASLNEERPAAPPPSIVEQQDPDIPFDLPEGYFLGGNKVWMEQEEEYTEKDEDGRKVTKTRIKRHLVCPYEIHVLAMYSDLMCTETTVSIAVRYPLGEWKVHELPMGAVYTGGKDYLTYLANKQIIIASEETVQRSRTFLMRYLEKVQQSMPTGVDFKRFGWQEDGSFLCGSQLIGSPTGNKLRRLRGGAASFANVLCQRGSREVWAETTRLVDTKGGEVMGVGLLSACMGALGNVGGAGTLVFSFFSTETGTGKTLSLLMGNSAAGDPVKILRNVKDTDNALYKVFGTFGDISCSIDEITSMSAERAVDLAYSASMGSEKLSLNKDRDIREAETWAAPTRVSTNTSLYYLYGAAMARNDPVRYRTLEFNLHDRTFVAGCGADLYHTLTQNYGFAMPELAEAVIAYGGRRAVWEKGVAAFDKKFKFTFEPQERFYRTACITCYILGKLGAASGLFRFNVDRVVEYMIDRVQALRTAVVEDKQDGFDTIGQFLQEHSHQLIVVKEQYGTKKAEVQAPVPEVAFARLDVVHDATNPVLPGSKLAINLTTLKQWLQKSKDNVDRLTDELLRAGALLKAKDRVTMFKGCHRVNPGQAYCLVVDATHPRLATAIAGNRPIPVTAPGAAVLHGTP